jgi:hypothetical protein
MYLRLLESEAFFAFCTLALFSVPRPGVSHAVLSTIVPLLLIRPILNGACFTIVVMAPLRIQADMQQGNVTSYLGMGNVQNLNGFAITTRTLYSKMALSSKCNAKIFFGDK